MKSYEEMARSVIEKGDVYLAKRERCISAAKKIGTGACAICCAAVFFGVLSYESEKPEISNKPAENIIFSEEELSCTTNTACSVKENDFKIPDKNELYTRSMNTLEYLSQLSGSIRTLYGNTSPHIFEGEFEYNFKDGIYHAVVNAVNVSDNSLSQRNEYYTDNEKCVELCDYNSEQNDIYTIKELSPERADYPYGEYPAHEIAVSFYPREMCTGYLENFNNWEITETFELNGRYCAMINGTAEPEYGSRFGVETFNITIDCDTGVWLQFEGYDSDGTVQAYVYTENIRFDNEAESVPLFTEECAEGYILDEESVSQTDISEEKTVYSTTTAKSSAVFTDTDIPETSVQTEPVITETTVTTVQTAIETTVSSTSTDMMYSGSCGENVSYELNETTRTLYFIGSGSDVDVSAALPLVGKFDTVTIDQGITSFEYISENHLFGTGCPLTIYCYSDFKTDRLQQFLGKHLTFIILDE